MTTAHIDVLVNAAAAYDVLHGQHPAAAGAALLALNQASYAHRYADSLDDADRQAVSLGYRLGTSEAPLHPYAVAIAVACWRYQSCEVPGWDTTAAAALAGRILAAAEAEIAREDPDQMTLIAHRHHRGPVPRYRASALYNRLPWGFATLTDATREHCDPQAGGSLGDRAVLARCAGLTDPLRPATRAGAS
ncbi:hypothetical protein [uncultured Pseudonocardia sp.]|uniref:hypothetical protein n=1 Tax=uncultured Pseudonocardia sp. TaxID=211455 RepID=UPI00260D187D|nr:hypothetical protein [uncultured Pseudonocardia sp.]